MICVCVKLALGELQILEDISPDLLMWVVTRIATNLLWHDLIQRVGATSELLASITVATKMVSRDILT